MAQTTREKPVVLGTAHSGASKGSYFILCTPGFQLERVDRGRQRSPVGSRSQKVAEIVILPLTQKPLCSGFRLMSARGHFQVPSSSAEGTPVLYSILHRRGSYVSFPDSRSF